MKFRLFFLLAITNNSFSIGAFGQIQSPTRIGLIHCEDIHTIPPDHQDELCIFLIKTMNFVVHHEWDSLLTQCDPEHKKMQMDHMNMSKPQYILEILGMNYVDNHLPIDRRIKLKVLEKITKLELTKVGPGEIFDMDAIGNVFFEEWKPIELRMRIHYDETQGRFYLYCSVG